MIKIGKIRVSGVVVVGCGGKYNYAWLGELTEIDESDKNILLMTGRT